MRCGAFKYNHPPLSLYRASPAAPIIDGNKSAGFAMHLDKPFNDVGLLAAGDAVIARQRPS